MNEFVTQFLPALTVYCVFWNLLPLGKCCDCNRHCLPWYADWHPKTGRWIFGIIGMALLGFLWFAVNGHTYFWWWSGFEVVALIVHERGKIKRAAKATGRVVIDAFGRLRVQPVPQGA